MKKRIQSLGIKLDKYALTAKNSRYFLFGGLALTTVLLTANLIRFTCLPPENAAFALETFRGVAENALACLVITVGGTLWSDVLQRESAGKR